MNKKKSKKPKERTQLISGIKYVYEDMPYWDKEKRQTRHRRNYIGTLDDQGEFIPNKTQVAKQRINELEQKSSKEKSLQADRKYYGAIHLLEAIGRVVGITEDLKACFGDDYQKIYSVAYYLILENDAPLYRFPKWAKTHYIPEAKGLCSQRITELFESISERSKMMFFEYQSRRRLENEYLAYDTTSISSYSELIEQVKFGNNKDKDSLPQINLALVFGQKAMLPVYYRKLPGNITDVMTIKKLIEDIEFLNIQKVKLVLDRGFFSKENIDRLYQAHYKFIAGAKCNNKFIKGFVDEARESIKDFKNYSIDQDVYCTSVMTKWPYTQKNRSGEIVYTSDKRIYVHIYYNAQRAESEKADFIKYLANAKQALIEGTDKESQKNLSLNYFNIKNTPVRGMQFEYNETAIREHSADFGYFSLLSNEIKEPIKALDYYRNKDLIEKAFSNLKNRLDMKRTGVTSGENLEGKLFVQFVALIYMSYIHQRMKEKNLYRNWSMITMLDELDIIERYDYESRKWHCGEITKKQKDLFEYFGVDLPNML